MVSRQRGRGCRRNVSDLLEGEQTVRKTLLSTLIPALLLGAWGVCPAQADSPEPLKPLALISFSGYNELFADVGFVGKISGKPELAEGIEGLVVLATQGRGLEGLDKDRPWGAVIQIDQRKVDEGETNLERLLSGFVFLPVTDLKALLGVFEEVLGKPEDAGHGLLKIGKDKQKPLFVKHVGGWVFLAPKSEFLADTPKDPLELLGELNEQYDLAVRFNVANVPASLRQLGVAKLKADVEADSERKPGENEEEHAIRVIVGKRTAAGSARAIDELEQITVGWALDHTAEKTYFDVTVSAKAGTDSARDFASLGESTTDFGGFFMPGAALAGNWTAKLAPDNVSELVTVVDLIRKKALDDLEKQGRPKAEAEAAKKLINGLLDVVRPTVASGRVDGGMALLLAPKAMTLVAGGYVADGPRLEETLKELAEAIRAEEPTLVAEVLKLDAAQFQGVNLHTLSVPVPDDADNRDQLVKLIGETAEIVIGIGPEAVYVAVGRDPMETLKQAISKSQAQSAEAVPLLKVSVALGALAKFAAEAGEEEDKPQAALLASLLAEAAGKDHVNLVATPIERGVRLRLEIEEGLLKAIGVIVASQTP